MVWNCEPFRALTTVCLGVSLGAEVNTIYSQPHRVKSGSQPSSQIVLYRRDPVSLQYYLC